MAQWRLEDLVQEIQHLEKLGKRKSAASILQRMYNSLVEKLKCCYLNARMALSLLEAIDDSNLPHEKKEFLLKALDGTAMASSNFKLSKCQQGVSHLPNYFSESDWAKFGKHTLLTGAMAMLMRRMKQMGLVSLTETCKKQALALLLRWSTEHGKPLPGPRQIYFTNVPCSVGSSETYPWNPLDMGEDWIGKVYGEHEKPACSEVHLAMYFDKVPLKSTSKLLQDIPRPGNANAPSAPVATPQNAPQLHEICCFFEILYFQWSK